MRTSQNSETVEYKRRGQRGETFLKEDRQAYFKKEGEIESSSSDS